MGMVNVQSVLLVRTIVNGVLFTSDLATPFIEIVRNGEMNQTIRVDPSVRLQSQGDLERFAVEWYYSNVLNHRAFGGREINSSYEVI